jgi:glutaredoxin
MIIFYALPTCPYCAKVRGKLNELGVSYNELSINEAENEKKLIELGGKRTVPYIVDDEKNVAMYESDKIVKFLEENYTKQ